MANKTGKGGFVKGKSGNPGGRPKVEGKVRELAQAACPAAIEYLAKLILDQEADHRVRVVASKEILDRGLGKALQQVAGTSEDGALVVKVIKAMQE